LKKLTDSGVTLTPVAPESDATETPEITKSGANEFTVRCHTGKSQVSPSPLSGVKSASLFKNCPEPSENRPEPSSLAPNEAGLLGEVSATKNGAKISKSTSARKNNALARAAVTRLFTYYLEQTNRKPKMYSLTAGRMDKGLSRLEDCRLKCDGDLVKAEKLMGLVIDALVASDFHQGKNEQRKEYTDWTDHLFKSTEKLEWWLTR
jgi:hypothetical protein